MPPEASAETIKRSFRKLAMKYHPDKNAGNTHAEAVFHQISEAYETLSDTDLRNKYDDLYEQHIHAQKQAQQAKKPQKVKKQSPGRNLLYHVNISLKDAFLGIGKTIKYVHLKKGARVTSELMVKIPAGIRDQKKLRVRGAGESKNSEQPAGDLLVVVHVLEDPLFTLMGADLHIKVPISPLDLLLKEDIIIPTLTGKVSVKPPQPSALQHPTLRLKNKGFRISESNSECGDLFVQFVIDVPDSIDENLRKTIMGVKKKLPLTTEQLKFKKRLE